MRPTSPSSARDFEDLRQVYLEFPRIGRHLPPEIVTELLRWRVREDENELAIELEEVFRDVVSGESL